MLPPGRQTFEYVWVIRLLAGTELPLGGKSLLFFGEVFQHFVGVDLKFPEESGAKAGAEGAVHSITSTRHHNAPNTRVIMPSVERIPPRTFGPG